MKKTLAAVTAGLCLSLLSLSAVARTAPPAQPAYTSPGIGTLLIRWMRGG